MEPSNSRILSFGVPAMLTPVLRRFIAGPILLSKAHAWASVTPQPLYLPKYWVSVEVHIYIYAYVRYEASLVKAFCMKT